MNRCAFVLSLVAVLGLVVNAHAVLIDDMSEVESADFQEVNQSGVGSATELDSSLSSVLGGVREIGATVLSGTGSAFTRVDTDGDPGGTGQPAQTVRLDSGSGTVGEWSLSYGVGAGGSALGNLTPGAEDAFEFGFI